MRPLARRLATVGLLGFGIAAGLAASEAILRIRGTVCELFAPHPDPELGYMLRPGLHGLVDGIEHAYNSRGLRDRDYPDRPPSGVTRILCVGDSITFAQNVPLEATFAKRMEERLNARRDGRVWEVLNGGVSGYNACNEEAFLRDIGFSYHPDIVVWEYTLNDLDDPWRPYVGKTRGFVPLPSSWKESLREHLIIWGYLRVQSYGLAHLLGVLPKDMTSRAYARRTFELYGDAEKARCDRSWQCIRRAREEIEAEGGEMLIVIVPLALQAVGDPEFGDAPQKEVDRMCREGGFDCLDLLPVFTREGGWDLYPKPDFVHLSEKGHEVTAAAIAETVLSRF